jgi:carboxyl-terminal processing protease
METSERNVRNRVASTTIPYSTVAIVLVALLVTAIGSFMAGYTVANAGVGRPDEIKVFWEAWSTAEQDFYYEKPSSKDRVYGAIRGMLAAYDDQFTMFEPPASAAISTQVMRGESGGIGARIAMDEQGQLVITEPMIGMPAEKAGVKAGDIITAVDDKPIKGLPLVEAVGMVRGPIGSAVKLTVKRGSDTTPREFSIVRQQINVYGKMMPDNIAYISLSLFSRTAPAEIKSQLELLLKEKPRALIFDLRGNPGGYFDEAIQVADLFLTDGPVASEKITSGESKQFKAKTGEIGEAIPIIVLVDKDSASASEIVAGALQDRKRAVLVGTRTYGKGSVQQLHTLSDGSQLRVTHGAWYTPNETPIQGKGGEHLGLTPDISIILPEKPDINSDPILDAALNYIKSHF